VKPRNIAVTPTELAIAWADGHESYFPFDALRASCPCALCRAEAKRVAEAGPLQVLRGPAPGQVGIAKLLPVGAYAVQIVWSDGHDSGIFAFEALRAACPCAACALKRNETPA